MSHFQELTDDFINFDNVYLNLSMKCINVPFYALGSKKLQDCAHFSCKLSPF